MIGMMFYLLKLVLLHSNVKITRLLPHQATKSLDTAHLAFQNENFQKQPLKLSPHEHTTIPKLVGTWISPWLFVIIQETSKIQLVYNQKNNNLQKWFNVATWKITGFQCQYCFPGWAAGAAALNKSIDFLMKYFRWNMLKHLKGCLSTLIQCIHWREIQKQTWVMIIKCGMFLHTFPVTNLVCQLKQMPIKARFSQFTISRLLWKRKGS